MTRDPARRENVRLWTALLLLSIPILAFGAGCADLDAADRFRAQAVGLQEAIRAEAERRETELAALPADSPDRFLLEAGAAEARSLEQVVASGVARLDEILAEARNPTDPLSETVGAASPLLPMSLRGPAILGAAALVASARAWRLKAGLASVARGLAAAMREDEEFRACFARHADTFRATQTPTAKRVVDETTGARPLLALPV